MEQTTQEFFHNFRQELMVGAEANGEFQLAEFMDAIAADLMETGFIEVFEFCHFRAQRGLRVDGYGFNDEGGLDLFIADFESRNELLSLTQTEVTTLFKRIVNFFEASREKKLYLDLEETSPEYGLARDISDRKGHIQKVNFYIFSERILSDRLQAIESKEISGIETSYHVWDMSRLQRQLSSRGHKEPLDINFVETFGAGLPCLPAHLGSESYQSYLTVIPGETLASLYGKYGARLLEQNVRSFLQARGKVNKGIRTTILNEPGMFFAYNNGITATAQEVETEMSEQGFHIRRLTDLQIVNGGQTTASLFHTLRKDKASLEGVFVQMKLSVIPTDASEEIVPKISEYANTQNRVNAADFFSNHPFHIRIEEFSRRIWAPAQQGAQRESKWFYERARGQYVDAQSKLTPGEQKRFKAEYPKPQMFSKTDLAKFENIWDDHPKWVNLGAQKNFARYAARNGENWIKSPDKFNEYYYKRAIVRGLIFRSTEKIVSSQSWYNGGYRANIVAYAIAVINELCQRKKMSVDYIKIWNTQALPQPLVDAITIAAKYVNDGIISPPHGISNISEWCKKDGCWQRLSDGLESVQEQFPESFWAGLIPIGDQKIEVKSARKIQKMDNGIDAQKRIIEVSAKKWSQILDFGQSKKLLTPKETDVIIVACQIPSKIPSEKQCFVLLDVLRKVKEEGFLV